MSGNINAKIGKERAFKTEIGNHSLYHITNNNGTKLIELAK